MRVFVAGASGAIGMVLEVMRQARRHQDVADLLLRRLIAGRPPEPRMIVTDKPAGDVPAGKKVFPRAEHRAHAGVNTRGENSHQPTRPGERARHRCKSAAQPQRFMEPLGPIRQHFCPGRPLLPAKTDRAILEERFAHWAERTGMAA